MHLLSMFFPNAALIDMNWYLFSRVRRPLSSQDPENDPHLLDHDLATRILRLFVNLIELGGEDRVVTGAEVTELVESIMPDMLEVVNSTENGVQSPRDCRIDYESLLENMNQALVRLILFLSFILCYINRIFKDIDMSRVIYFAEEHPSLAQDGVAPLSPDSSRVSDVDRNLQLNQEFQRGPLIFEASSSSSSSSDDSAGRLGPLLPPENPAPPSVNGGKDPFTTLVEMGQVHFVEPTQWYKLNFDPARLRLAHGGGGLQLLVEVDPNNELEVESIAAPGVRAVGIQVQPASTTRSIQYDRLDFEPDESTDVSTASTAAALQEHEQFVAHRELTK